jgi:hypothetical protein
VVVSEKGLEPPTSGVSDRRSLLLSYPPELVSTAGVAPASPGEGPESVLLDHVDLLAEAGIEPAHSGS